MADIVKVTFGIQDAKSANGHVLYYTTVEPWFDVFGGQYMDTLKEYFKEIAARLDVIINGKIVSINISIDCDLPDGIKVSALAHSDVEEGAEFKFLEGATSAYFRHRIPTFNHDLFGTGQKTLDWETGDEDVNAYTMLVSQATDAPDWTGEYGRITDNRGSVIYAGGVIITKKFKASNS